MSTRTKGNIITSIIAITSLAPGLALAQAAQDPNANCIPSESSSLTPGLTNEAADSMDSSNQVVQKHFFHMDKLPMFRFGGSVLLQSGGHKSITTSANFDPTAPNAANDSLQAYDLFLAITHPGGSCAAPASTGSQGSSAPIAHMNCGAPTDIKGYDAYLKTNCAPLSANAKRAFIGSFIGNFLDGHYSGSKDGSTQQTLTAIQGGNVPTGECGPIAQFMSETMSNCGLPDSGVFSAIGHLDNPDQGHYVPFFKDPETGTYVVYNYGQAFDTHEKLLKDAVEVANAQLGDGSRMSVIFENGKPGVLARIAEGAHTNAILQNAEDLGPDHAHIEVNAGNDQTLATARLSGTTRGGTQAGVFGTVALNPNLDIAALGFTVKKAGAVNLSDKTLVTGSAQVAGGVSLIHDVPPGSLSNALTGPHTTVQGFENGDFNAGISHQSSNKNLISADASAHVDGGFGQYILPPYENFHVEVADRPNLRSFVQTTFYAGVDASLVAQSAETTKLSLNVNRTDLGVNAEKVVKGVDVHNNTTVSVFGSPSSPTGVGVHDEVDASKTFHGTTVDVYNHFSHVSAPQNSPIQQPNINEVGVNFTRDTSRATLTAGASYRNISENPVINEGPYSGVDPLDAHAGDTHPPTVGFHLNVDFHRKVSKVPLNQPLAGHGTAFMTPPSPSAPSAAPPHDPGVSSSLDGVADQN